MSEIQPTATRWGDLRFDELKDAICEKWHGVQRRTFVDGWDLGRGLRVLKNQMQHGEFRPFLASINMSSSTAHRFMELAEGIQMSQLGTFASMEDGLKSLHAKREDPEPEPEPTQAPEPEPEALTGEVVTDAEAEQAMAEAAAEAEPDPETEREEREERLAHRLEGTDGDAVDVLNAKLDKAAEQHRDDVNAYNDAVRRAASDRLKLSNVRDALLAKPGCPCCDDVLARFFGVARKVG